MSGVVARIPRPKSLSHIQKGDLYKNIYLSTGLGLLVGLGYWYGHAIPYQRRFEEFTLNYDPFEDFERMRKLGLFQGAPPDEVIEEMKTMKKFQKKFKK